MSYNYWSNKTTKKIAKRRETPLKNNSLIEYVKNNFIRDYDYYGAGAKVTIYMHNDKIVSLCFYYQNPFNKNEEGIAVPLSQWSGWSASISYEENEDKKFANELKKKIKKIYPQCYVDIGKI